MTEQMDAAALAEAARRAGDLPPEVRDGAEEAFEQGGSRRERAREERRVQSLLKDRHQDRSRIADLERRLAEADAARAKGRVTDLDADMAEAEKEARNAFADGDADAAAKANRRLAELAAERKAAELEEQQVASAARTQKGPAPEAAEWIERNSEWFQKDQRKTKLALLAHDEAVNVEGFAPNSPEYFEFIEERVESKFPGTVTQRSAPADDTDLDDEDEAPPARQPRPAASRGAAPVTRAPSGGGARPGRTLAATPAQVEAAKIAGVPITEYMARNAVLRRAGRLEIGRR